MQPDSSGASPGDDLSERLERVARMTDDFFTNLSAQDRDRMLQVHLAQARGPALNGDLLCEMTDLLFALRRGLERNDR